MKETLSTLTKLKRTNMISRLCFAKYNNLLTWKSSLGSNVISLEDVTVDNLPPQRPQTRWLLMGWISYHDVDDDDNDDDDDDDNDDDDDEYDDEDEDDDDDNAFPQYIYFFFKDYI